MASRPGEDAWTEMVTGMGGPHCSVESENREQSGIYAPLLFRCEMTGKVTEALDVDSTDVLDENPSSGAIDVDLWPEGGRPRTRRRRGHEHH